MQRISRILTLCLLLCSGGYAQDGEQYWQLWNGEWTTPQTREIILWFTRNYGAAIGAKCVLETSGGADMNHGEDSHGYLGLYLPEVQRRRPGLADEILRDLLANNRHFQGQLAKEIDDENLYNMRKKRNPRLDAAMVYPGWTNWNNPDRLNRGLLDLQWQDFLKGMINEME